MDSERIEKSLRSARLVLAAKEAVQELFDALEASTEDRMRNLPGLEVDAEGSERSLRASVPDVENAQ